MSVLLPNFPKIDVAPTKGLVSNQILVHIVDVYPHSRLFSGETISVVHVIRIDSVVLIAIFDVILVTMRSITLSKPATRDIEMYVGVQNEKRRIAIIVINVV